MQKSQNYNESDFENDKYEQKQQFYTFEDWYSIVPKRKLVLIFILLFLIYKNV